MTEPTPPRVIALPADTVVTFEDAAGAEYRCQTLRMGHTDGDVIAVAYRWACKQVAEGEWMPHGCLQYVRIGALL